MATATKNKKAIPQNGMGTIFRLFEDAELIGLEGQNVHIIYFNQENKMLAFTRTYAEYRDHPVLVISNFTDKKYSITILAYQKAECGIQFSIAIGKVMMQNILPWSIQK